MPESELGRCGGIIRPSGVAAGKVKCQVVLNAAVVDVASNIGAKLHAVITGHLRKVSSPTANLRLNIGCSTTRQPRAATTCGISGDVHRRNPGRCCVKEICH